MNTTSRNSQKVQAILEHSDGIRCMAFSPCNNYLVSVGTVHDQCIIVYRHTQTKGWVKVAAAKFKDIIDAVVWSKRRIITVGRRHLRVWEWQEDSVSISLRGNANDRRLVMYTSCRIGTCCIVILMTMRSSLQLRLWRETLLRWHLAVAWFIRSMPRRGKSKL